MPQRRKRAAYSCSCCPRNPLAAMQMARRPARECPLKKMTKAFPGRPDTPPDRRCVRVRRIRPEENSECVRLTCPDEDWVCQSTTRTDQVPCREDPSCAQLLSLDLTLLIRYRRLLAIRWSKRIWRRHFIARRLDSKVARGRFVLTYGTRRQSACHHGSLLALELVRLAIRAITKCLVPLCPSLGASEPLMSLRGKVVTHGPSRTP